MMVPIQSWQLPIVLDVRYNAHDFRIIHVKINFISVREVFDYMRAIIAKGEKSQRALELTTEALRLNPANYTVWQYRRDILRAVDADLQEELDYLDEVIGQNAKNYQVWHHRRVIVEMMNCAQWELELTQNALDNDGNAKNYHAWQHRQWAIRTFK